MNSLQCSRQEAEQIVKNYEEGFKGTAEFAKKASREVRNKGYILVTPVTGHKTYWYDWEYWKERDKFYHSDQWSWTDYTAHHKGTGDAIERDVKTHYKVAAKWDRLARNVPTQGTGACILKHSQILLFHWVVKHNYFGKIKLCTLVHDECNWEYPETLVEFPKIVKTAMEKAAAVYCKSLPIPAEADVEKYWKHE